MSMKKVELLSPAGGYETMVGAFNAGADAVYLGGSKFGARAYADNFDRDQVLDAVSYAHLHGKKIYMTVNTLVKEGEFSQLYDFMLPYAQAGLDGVIVQDYGVMRLIRSEFPGIELHASTQQAVTGVNGARLLKKRGFTRVVPARELSLEEMKAIRREADIEVEAFIHGAMCYCYSGVCLFSGIVGGRSGNRGRCAQPCRLPYRTRRGNGKEIYPLSLKDMNTVRLIPKLIEAGIDSFKIEGRMKKPEYSAGVTALYRKYIDRYYADPDGDFEVSGDDLEILRSLYQRTGTSEGYYFRHNDRAMVTVTSPAYNPTSKEILEKVHDKYLTSSLTLKADIDGYFRVGEPSRLTMKVLLNEEELVVSAEGNVVQPASKRPMDEDSIRKQLVKLGGTGFEAGEVKIFIDDDGTGSGIFVAVSELNELRRNLVGLLDEKIKESFAVSGQTSEFKAHRFDDYNFYKKREEKKRGLCVLVNTAEQLGVVLDRADGGSVKRVYIDSNVFLSLSDPLLSRLKECKTKGAIPEVYAAFPYITRTEDFDGVKEIADIIKKVQNDGFDGVLVRNLEQLGYLENTGYSGSVILDYGVYLWNSESALEMIDLCDPGRGFMIDELTAPYELSYNEAADMVKALKKTADIPVSYNIYGHIPMMVSAGCISKTTDKCSGRVHELYSTNTRIYDRMDNEIPVTCNCRNCYNVIWNAYPTSLHKKLDRILKEELFDSFRLDFTIEDRARTGEILDYYMDRFDGRQSSDIFEKSGYTTGYFKRGVE